MEEEACTAWFSVSPSSLRPHGRYITLYSETQTGGEGYREESLPVVSGQHRIARCFLPEVSGCPPIPPSFHPPRVGDQRGLMLPHVPLRLESAITCLESTYQRRG